MLFKKIKHFISIRSRLDTSEPHLYTHLKLKKRQWITEWLLFVQKTEHKLEMSSAPRFRLLFCDTAALRLWGVWSKSFIVSLLVKRCKKERVKEFLQCFRQTFLRPKRTLLLSVTAAYKAPTGHDEEKYDSCNIDITDAELETLVSDLDYIEELMKNTLYCKNCGKRLVIDKKLPGITYCSCKNPVTPTNDTDGWQPYLETEDVFIWRKEYKPGQGLYAYKVYGRYKESIAEHFAAIQLDVKYRRQWDDAVAALSILQHNANGVKEQALVYWEVQWPRLFTNRDYVYLRRHTSYEVPAQRHRDVTRPSVTSRRHTTELSSVHARAKRKAMEEEEAEQTEVKDNQVYVIVSRSCEHPQAPSSRAVRVTEYWSHMCVRTLRGKCQPGMEFVLTYYDEPAVGGLPAGVTTWATGRAAPAYLQRMRAATNDYPAYLSRQETKEVSSDTTADMLQKTEPSEVKENDQIDTGKGDEKNQDVDKKTDEIDQKTDKIEQKTDKIEQKTDKIEQKAAVDEEICEVDQTSDSIDEKKTPEIEGDPKTDKDGKISEIKDEINPCAVVPADSLAVANAQNIIADEGTAITNESDTQPPETNNDKDEESDDKKQKDVEIESDTYDLLFCCCSDI